MNFKIKIFYNCDYFLASHFFHILVQLDSHGSQYWSGQRTQCGLGDHVIGADGSWIADAGHLHDCCSGLASVSMIFCLLTASTAFYSVTLFIREKHYYCDLGATT